MEKKTVLFVVLDKFADWEGAALAAELQQPSAEKPSLSFTVKTVSLSKEPIRSIGGFTVLPDYDLKDRPNDYSGLILIGGDSWRNPEAEPIAELVQEALDKGAIVGAICDATTFLAKHGFLNAVRHTGNFLNDFKSYAGSTYTNEVNFLLDEAVIDGNLITANGNAPIQFGKLVLDALGADPEVNQMWVDFHTLGFHPALRKYGWE